MKVLLFLAVFALATQVHSSELTEFYRTFVNNIPMDAQTKNQIMNDGLDCLNTATNSLIMAVGKIQQDVNNKNLINVLRDVIGSAEVLEKTVLPKCAQTYMQLAFYLQSHADYSQVADYTKRNLFQARLIQLFTKTVFDAVASRDSGLVAKDLAVLVDTAFGLIDANLPTIMEFDYSKYVQMTEQQAVPLFFKGFFNGLGVYDSATINGTSQCVLGVISALKTIFTNPALQRGDFYTKAYALLDSLMPLTDSLEKCQKLNLVDMSMLARINQLPIDSLARTSVKSFAKVAFNYAMNAPEIVASQTNMSVLMSQGQFERAGQLYAQNLKTVYKGLLF